MPSVDFLASYGSLPDVDHAEFDAPEPDLAEADAVVGRALIAALEGAAPLVKLLDSPVSAVVCGGLSALFNLAMEERNATALLQLRAFQRLQSLLASPDDQLAAAAAGVLMNCAAASAECRRALLAQGLIETLLPILASAVGKGPGLQREELAAAALGALNNLLLEGAAAQALAAMGLAAQSLLLGLLRDPELQQHEAILEDAASSLLRLCQEESKSCAALVATEGVFADIVRLISSANEELEIRGAGLLACCCAEGAEDAQLALYKLDAVTKLLNLLSSSSEEVQEAAAYALEVLSALPKAAVATRREGGVGLLIELMGHSLDDGVRLSAVRALRNCALSDAKTAAAVREADGLPPLVRFLSHTAAPMRISAAFVVEHCAHNETNKTILREEGAIEALVKMLYHEQGVDEHVASLGAIVELLTNEEEAVTLLRLHGGLRRLQPLLYKDDSLRPMLTSRALFHCAQHMDMRLAMRLADTLRPLVLLLSSMDREARLASAGALMHATRETPTNHVKCRELGAVLPLLSLLEPPSEGVPDAEMELRVGWALSNITQDAEAAKQLRHGKRGYAPLVNLLKGSDVMLQRPAAACLYNALVSDLMGPEALQASGALAPLIEMLGYALNEENADIVAWAAGALLNSAHKRGDHVGPIMAAIPALLGCLQPGADTTQNANSAGVLMNLSATGEGAAEEILARDGLRSLLELLTSAQEEPEVCIFTVGAVANVCLAEGGREALLARGGVHSLVETLDGDDEEQKVAVCTALLNACHECEGAREALADANGLYPLLECLLSGALPVRVAAAGALLNASASRTCAEALRDLELEVDPAEGGGGDAGGAAAAAPVHSLQLLSKLLHTSEPILRVRAAGILMNLSAWGPENRLAIVEGGVLKAVVGALFSECAETHSSLELHYRMQSNLIGAVANAALNPVGKKEALELEALKPLLECVVSEDRSVQAMASTAIAYLNDKSEHRPGTLFPSAAGSAADPLRQSLRKKRFHISGPDASPAAAADDEAEDAPGARTKAEYGTLPLGKVSATHDSAYKCPRFVQEPVELFQRRATAPAAPQAVEAPYEEIETPMPSRHESEAEDEED